MDGTPVEIRESADSTVWYEGLLVNVAGDGKASVAFSPVSEWPTTDYAPDCVRLPPPPSTDKEWVPRVGEPVEADVAEINTPPAWRSGVVAEHRLPFIYIQFPGQAKTSILEKHNIRPVSTQPPLTQGMLSTARVDVEPGLSEWAQTDDVRGCLSQVQTQSGVLLAKVIVVRGGRVKVLLIGSAMENKRAKLLLELHLSHQLKMQQFYDRRDKRLKVIEARRAKYENASVEEFHTDARFVGMIIGKGGANIQAVQEKFEVEISVTNASEAQAKVRIVGGTKESVVAARQNLEYVTDQFSVPPGMQNWLDTIVNLDDLRRNADLYSCYWSDENDVVEMQGLARNVRDAKVMLETHLQYAEVYVEMERDEDSIRQQLRELDPSSYYRGKGKGKGKSGGMWGGGDKGRPKGEGWSKGKGYGKGEDDDKGKGKGGKGSKGGKGMDIDLDSSSDEDAKGKGKGKGKSKGKGKGKDADSDENEDGGKGKGKSGGKGKGPPPDASDEKGKGKEGGKSRKKGK
eukprot:CAMPEP_0204327916 /NCGR_PEP_ID=MMETSP0469-20131031/12972_1 /ASSEMBLY_ACC=CAM_ASM_000384 /TAXON_ID=2969 /ORGANISM="Oxyrrhis marina" /LENGTH=514 /DNA_ID=CAMNT_0051310225 /DNA_START=44 /DNA_END=1588 /DNA_ORIENTATION=-